VYKHLHFAAEAELRQISSRLDLLFARSGILNRFSPYEKMRTFL
jgi:hypothetical protein